MAASDIEELVALALVFVVHVIGGLLLVWALLDDDTRTGWRRDWRRRRGDEPRPIAPSPRSSPAVARPQLPLPGADASRVRLRGPGRLADGYPPARRRPGHAPEPTRAPR